MFAAAAIVRLIVATQLWDLPLVRTPKLDSFEYLAWARRLASGDFSWPAVSSHGPGYPLFLAALLTIGSGSLRFVMAAQALMGACTATFVGAAAREWFGPRVALAAGLAYALYGPAVYIDTAILSEGLLLFLLTLAVALLARERVTLGRACGAGAALGAAAVVRPTAMLTAAAIVAWMTAVLRRRQPDAFRLAAAASAACIVVLSPALLKSWSVSHTLSVQGYGGLSFYIGNSPLHDGRATFRLGAGYDALNAEPSLAGITDPTAQDRYYVAKTIAEIRQHPAGFLAVIAKKIAWTVQAEESRDSHSYYFFADRSLLLRVMPRMALLLPLACVGFFALGRRAPSLLVFYTASAAAATVLLVVGLRYRMPLVPGLSIAAGAAVVALVDAVAARRTRELAMLAGAAALAVVVSQTLHDPRNTNLSEEWAFTGLSLITEHDLSGAESAYRTALALDPQSSFAWDGLGLAQYDAGRLRDARQSLTRAVALDPASARATYHLALVDARDGKQSAAIDGYRRAASLSPDDAAILRDLATALGMAGRSVEARTEMQRVVRLAPQDGEAWLDLCLLALDTHDVAAGAEALARARELGADPRRLAFAADALARAQQR